jgi:hypothetical protein
MKRRHVVSSGDPKKVAKRREQNGLAARRSREKRKHDQVRNEVKTEEEKEPKRGRGGGGQFARIWGVVNQQNDFISELEMGIAKRDGLVARHEGHISGLRLLTKGLNEPCDSQSACIREVRDGLREANGRQAASIQEPMQVNHSELLACLSGAATEEPTQ